MGFLSSLKELADSGFVLLGVTGYRAILYMMFLSASIAPSVLITHVYNSVTGFDPLHEVVEAIICMLLMRCWAEFAVGIEPKICGSTLQAYKMKYPNTMSIGRFTVNISLYFFAFCQLYIQFEEAHEVPHNRKRRGHNVSEDSYPEFGVHKEDPEKGWNTAYFLLALSYLVFATTMTFHKNVLAIIENLSSPYSILSNCMIRIGLAILHLMVNLIYFCPCFAIAFTSRQYKEDGFATYFQLVSTATLSGMIAALFEMNSPWPKRRGQMPFLFFENNMIAKDKLIMLWVSLIIVFFYRPFRHVKVPANGVSPNTDLLNFCLMVAFTVLHLVKYGVHSLLTLAQDFDVERDPNLFLAPPPEIDDILPDQDPERNESHPVLSPEARHALEQTQRCQQCTNLALNNNNDGPDVKPPDNYEPQGTPLDQGDTELDSAAEPEVVILSSHNQQKADIRDVESGVEQQVEAIPEVQNSNEVDILEAVLKHSQSCHV